MADYLSKYPIREFLQMLGEDDRKPKYIEIVFYIKKGV